MSGWGYFFLFLLLVAIIFPLGWVAYTRFRAHRAGLPPPPLSSYNPFSNRRSANSASQIYPASSGVGGWFKDKFSFVREKVGGGRASGGGGVTRAGAYEQTLGSSGRGRRGLDPDEAWDSRVGAEADGYGAGGYYEEQELGLTGAGGHERSYSEGGGGIVMPEYGAGETSRGRTVGRDEEDTAYVGGSQAGLNARYDEEMRGGRRSAENPFGDGAERSELRGVSRRPAVEAKEGSLAPKKEGDSPTERRSMFRENV